MCEVAFGVSLGLGLAVGWSLGFIGSGWLTLLLADRRKQRR